MNREEFQKGVAEFGANKALALVADWLENLGPSEFEAARLAAAKRLRLATERLWDDSLPTIPELEKTLSAGSWIEVEGIDEEAARFDTVDGALEAAKRICDCDDPEATELTKLVRHFEVVEAPGCSRAQCGEDAHGLNNAGRPECETHLFGKETEL